MALSSPIAFWVLTHFTGIDGQNVIVIGAPVRGAGFSGDSPECAGFAAHEDGRLRDAADAGSARPQPSTRLTQKALHMPGQLFTLRAKRESRPLRPRFRRGRRPHAPLPSPFPDSRPPVSEADVRGGRPASRRAQRQAPAARSERGRPPHILFFLSFPHPLEGGDLGGLGGCCFCRRLPPRAARRAVGARRPGRRRLLRLGRAQQQEEGGADTLQTAARACPDSGRAR